MPKPTYLLLAFTLMMSHAASAQFFAGFSGGMNVANVSFTNLDFHETNSQSYAFGGLHSGYAINDKWSFITDLHFSQKGYFGIFDDPVIASPDFKARYSYLDIIPLIEYSIHNNLAISAGGYISYLLQDAYSSSPNDWNTPEDEPVIARFDGGVVAALKLKLRNFFIFSRYQHGLGNIQKLIYTDINGMTIDDVTQRNYVFQFGAGYIFFRSNTVN